MSGLLLMSHHVARVEQYASRQIKANMGPCCDSDWVARFGWRGFHLFFSTRRSAEAQQLVAWRPPFDGQLLKGTLVEE